MKPKPFGERRENGILSLVLDTPGGEVNVLGQEAASHLLELLAPARLGGVQAVVVRSGKRGSFVNGAGLLMANTARRPEDAGITTTVIRRAYRALRELPVPVIAAISGNCYGCGVEFALHAAYRVAERSQDTHFYMTEIADYLFLPTFGSTQDLPRLIGLENAVDFLLWGARWTADDALSCGLVDACFDSNDFEDGLRGFVEDVVSGSRPTPLPVRRTDLDAVISKTRERISTLPPMYRDLYAEGLDLLVRAARADHREPAGYTAEIAACGRSLMNPMAKAALSTFFVRQLAKGVSVRGARAVDRVEVVGVPALLEDLTRRRVRDLTVTDGRTEGDSNAAIRFVAYGAAASADDVAVALAPPKAPIEWRSGVVAYAPIHRADKPLVEIAGRDGASDVATVAELFTRAGYTAVATRPGRRFVIDEMADAFFDPIRRFVEGGGAPATVARTLRDFGFVRSPATLARLVDADVALPESDAEAGTTDGALLDAVLTSLLGFAANALATRTVPHPSVTDVIARELLDFPLSKATLCKCMSGPFAGELVERCATFAHYVGEAALESARKYAAEGTYFYR